MLFALLLLPFGLAAAAPLVARHGRRAAAWTAALAPLGVLAVLGWAAPRVLAGGVLRAAVPWAPAAGLAVSLRLDALAWLFALLVAAIGLLVVLYAAYYLDADDRLGRFYGLLLAFMGAMLGVVAAGDLVFLVVAWELTSLCSFFLVAYWWDDAEARAGARTALTVTAGGGLALLGGVLLLARAAGSTDLDVVLAAGDRVRASPLYAPALGLVLLGAFTKSAQWPFHFWLPRAMAAPTPASAYLHSATMVKAGVFLLARLHPVLAGTDAWFVVVTGAGLVTLLYGAYAAVWQHDLKGLLAYSTVSHLGLITMLLGLGSGTAVAAAIFHVFNHAAFKASLFMAAGIVDHEAGTRDMRVLNGLARTMPWTAALAVVAAAAMAGVPLLNGFLSKEMFFAEAVDVPRRFGLAGVRLAVPGAALAFGVLSVAYSARFVMEVFFNPDPTITLPRPPHEPPRFMRLPVELLVVTCVVVGVAPAAVAGPALAAATAAALQAPGPEVSLAVWHGLTLPLGMTVLALVGGWAVYRRREALYAWHDRMPTIPEAAELFNRGVRLAERAAAALTRRLETGSLQRSTAVLLAVALAASATGALAGPAGAAPPRVPGLPADPATAVGAALLAVSAVAAAWWHRNRLAALVATSAVGLFVSLAFVRLSAPDLALTQLLVEVVTILLVLLALYHLPEGEPREPSRVRRARDLALAGGTGAGAAALAWTLLGRAPFGAPGGGAAGGPPGDVGVSDAAAYYLGASEPLGGGTNAVNVILVDFRGLDTLGEVTVLACAALGASVLLDGARPLPAPPARPYDRDRHPLVLAVLTRPFLPFALLLAAFLFVRGHDLPGGGFAAGLLAAVALASQYLTSGIAWTTERLRLDPRRWVAAGVAVAALTGLGAFAFGRPFLTSFYRHLHVPVLGDVGVGSAMAFDLGVFAAVLGAVLLVLTRLGTFGAPAAAPGGAPAGADAPPPDGAADRAADHAAADRAAADREAPAAAALAPGGA